MDDIREALRVLQDSYGAGFALTARERGETDQQYNARIDRKLRTWAGALSGLSRHELIMGVRRCVREVPYAKTLTPADITTRATLDPVALGMPTARHAFIEAAREIGKPAAERRYSHPAVQVASAYIQSGDWGELTARQLWPQFEYAYTQCARRIINGENLADAIPKALPASVTSTEKARATPAAVALDNLRKARKAADV